MPRCNFGGGGGLVLLGVCTKVCVGGPLWVGPVEFLAPRLIPSEPPAFHLLQFRFLVLHWFPWRSLLVDFFPNKLWFFAFVCLSLQLGGQWFALWPRFSDKSKKSSFFGCLDLYLLQWRDVFLAPYILKFICDICGVPSVSLLVAYSTLGLDFPILQNLGR